MLIGRFLRLRWGNLEYTNSEMPSSPEHFNDEIIAQQVAEQINQELFSVPWGHHMLLIDKCKGNPKKALFYVHQTVQNGWSRNMLLNFLDTVGFRIEYAANFI